MQDKFGKTLVDTQAKSSDKRITWNAESVLKVRQAINDGFEPKHSPFYENDIFWRKGNIVYDYTKEELAEIKKCKSDILHFANKYCYLMTDDGYTNITTYDYQDELLVGFKNFRKSVVLSARQMGKCFSFNTLITVKYPDSSTKTLRFGKFYYEMLSNERKLTILEKIKMKLYSLI